MATLNKVDRPKIYTETDQILSDLTQELADLKSRMTHLEEDQLENRELVEQLVFKESLANEIIDSQKEEIDANKENYGVIAGVMRDLKTPVSNVVDNLSGIIDEIDDPETKGTLKDCMQTASNILESFNDIEEFCEFEATDKTTNQKWADYKTFFASAIDQALQQCGISNPEFLRLRLDPQLPESGPLHQETVKSCLSGLVAELTRANGQGQLDLSISKNHCEQKYGIELSDLNFQLTSSTPTELRWLGSWVDTLSGQQEKLNQSGLVLMKIRDLLRHNGGSLELILEQDRIKGFSFSLPLTY